MNIHIDVHTKSHKRLQTEAHITFPCIYKPVSIFNPGLRQDKELCSLVYRHANLPSKLQRRSSRLPLLLQGLSFTSWTGFYGPWTLEERERFSIQFRGAKGIYTLEFIFLFWSESLIEMLIQESCSFAQMNFSTWQWKQRGQKGL